MDLPRLSTSDNTELYSVT